MSDEHGLVGEWFDSAPAEAVEYEPADDGYEYDEPRCGFPR